MKVRNKSVDLEKKLRWKKHFDNKIKMIEICISDFFIINRK